MEKFKQLQLSAELLEAISKAGFTEPSEIQQKTIPLALAGKDVIGSSATGSGKTLAFGAGLIDATVRGGGIQALILTPTRELAEQVGHTLGIFSRPKGLRVRQIYGGVSMGPQISDLRMADIVVGTPGRILDHLERRTLNLSRVKILVLDEADRMLDMGFIRDVEQIVKLCPTQRQTLLFSATMSRDIAYMAQRYMNHPVHVSAGEKVDPAKLPQVYYDVPSDMKLSLLGHLLKQEKDGVVMVFCNTRRNTDRLAKNLSANGLHALPIHGGLSQNQRSNVLAAFHSKEVPILVCTDVAARGLDIKDVSHVYNYDFPKTGNDYIHRIGRTARAGKNGIAVSFVSMGEHGDFRAVCRESSLKIEKLAVPHVERIQAAVSGGSRGGFGGNRGGGHSRGFGGGGRGGGRSFGGPRRHTSGRSDGRGDGRGREGRNRFGGGSRFRRR